MRTVLILDCNFLAYRAFHTTGGLSVGAMKTGVLYGFFTAVVALKDRFNTSDVIYCFDSRHSKRKELFPDYKRGRHDNLTAEDLEARKQMIRQVNLLRDKILPGIGCGNVLCKKGYEADDMIASVTMSKRARKWNCIMVSADNDLLQLISPNVSFHNPIKGRTLTYMGFREKYGIEPKDWIKVKSIAGCSTDKIPGIGGVGEKSAIDYLTGALIGGKRFKIIDDALHEDNQFLTRNESLVKLPFEGTPRFKPKQDTFSKKKWKEMCRLFKFRHISFLSARENRAAITKGQGFQLA